MARDDDRDRDQPRRRAYNDRDERPSDRDRETRSSSRDDDRPQREAGRDRDRGARDDDRGRDRDRDRDDDRGRSSYRYEKRDDEDARRRATSGGDRFDKYLNPDIKSFKPRDGVNTIRILPPTWAKPKHYGFDLFIHYGVGADEQTYLCLKNMRDEADAYFKREKIDGQGGKDPVEEEAASLVRSGDSELGKKMKAKQRGGIYLIDRDAERDGVQFWAMPSQIDRNVLKQSINRRTGAALAIDDPDEGYDVSFDKEGSRDRTRYSGESIERQPSALGNSKWIQWAVDHPIPEQLIFYTYDHIRDVLNGGGGAHQSRRDRDDDRGGRDDDRSRDSRNDDRGRERDDRGRGRGAEPTWEAVHDMTMRELEDLIDDKRLDIKPKEAKDDADLADWVCEEMKLRKPEPKERDRGRDDDRGRRDEPDDRLTRMREERDRDRR